MSVQALIAQLGEGPGHLCRCWEVVRADGTRLGFTDHDCALSFDGLTFEAGAGLNAGAVERSTGLSVDNSVALGALSSDRVTEADLLSGRYDGAAVRQWLVDWSDVSGRTQVFHGSIGEVRVAGGAFEADLRGLSEALNQPIGRGYLKTCDRVLGDAKCGVDIADPAYSVEGVVVASSERLAVSWDDTDGYAQGWFTGGALSWLSGANAGLGGLVRLDSGEGAARRLSLWTAAPSDIGVGDGFRIIAGCDKHFETCREKFGNTVNFRGFPHMPGEDWVTAYPKSGKSNDGSVRRWEALRHDI